METVSWCCFQWCCLQNACMVLALSSWPAFGNALLLGHLWASFFVLWNCCNKVTKRSELGGHSLPQSNLQQLLKLTSWIIQFSIFIYKANTKISKVMQNFEPVHDDVLNLVLDEISSVKMLPGLSSRSRRSLSILKSVVYWSIRVGRRVLWSKNQIQGKYRDEETSVDSFGSANFFISCLDSSFWWDWFLHVLQNIIFHNWLCNSQRII